MEDIKYDKNSIPEGTFVLTRGWEDKLYNVQDMKYMRSAEVGQLFLGVARYYDKSPKEYGALWPTYLNQKGEPSKAYTKLKESIFAERTDYNRLVLVCKHLNEEVPQCIEDDK